MFNGYNAHLLIGINECREIQNAVSLQEEINVVILHWSKLRGRTRKALHNRKFISIKQFIDQLKISFGVIGDIFDSYAELKKLCVKWRESIVNYIERTQIMYDNIIEAEKSKKESLTDSNITKLPIRAYFIVAYQAISECW